LLPRLGNFLSFNICFLILSKRLSSSACFRASSSYLNKEFWLYNRQYRVPYRQNNSVKSRSSIMKLTFDLLNSYSRQNHILNFSQTSLSFKMWKKSPENLILIINSRALILQK
jgi:hypothetical protein